MPAYRGLAYVVFERMPLKRFGNRMPQLTFEVFRPVDDFEEEVQGVTLIPAAGEFVYDTQEVTQEVARSETRSENLHTGRGGTDFTVSVDDLQATLPNVGIVSLFASWFGTDLLCGNCQIKPKVDLADKSTDPYSWAAGGISRSDAEVISLVDGRAAFGGSPSDRSIVHAIQDLHARGLKVGLTPFILMDIPAGNSLTNPYTGTAGQPVYPWRGRITCSPAPGQPGTPDKTALAAAQVAAFVGTAQPSHFAISGETVTYSGPAEFSYRRFILHMAKLAQAAGGVDVFVIGSEMRGLTWVRDGASHYPFVDALIALAADVSGILPSAKVVYAADWSEWFGHQPQDGSGDVIFHLDPLWASSDIDAIGIDCYWPLADWRDGAGHLDQGAGARSTYELPYLKGNIFGGEGYDWFYASAADRENQIRTPITDGAIGKPWVFRFKDVRSWWQNQHFNRPAGVESGTPTAWVPQSKPFWFTETGCGAVDKGANQPNLFYDPKSSESGLPYFSRGTRDDFMQRRYLQALIEFFDPSHPEFVAASNPISSVYGDRMVDVSRIFAYTWDARPYPAFPNRADVWGDGGNWERGHWLTGRMGGGTLQTVVAAILGDYGFEDYDATGLTGSVHGYVIDRIMSVRQALQPLELAFFFDAHESGSKIVFTHRGRAGVSVQLTEADLVEGSQRSEIYSLVRAQEGDLPSQIKLRFIDADKTYKQAAVDARRLGRRSDRVSTASVPVVMPLNQAQAIAESWLQEVWSGRERATFSLPPSFLALEPTDTVSLDVGDRTFVLRITGAGEGAAKSVEALSIDPEVFTPIDSSPRPGPETPGPVFGPAIAAFMDLPLITGAEAPHAGRLAATSTPWPGGIAFYRSPGETGFILGGLALAPATLGEITTPFFSAVTSRWDRGNVVRVELYRGEIASATELAVLNGVNLAAIENADSEWEVLQFLNATLVGPRTYDISGLLRGQFGTERAMRDSVAAGARFVVLDAAVAEADMTRDEVGLAFNWRYGPVNLEITHQSYRHTSKAFIGAGLRPLSPVHIRGTRSGGGDLTITWVRRTRIGGDGWEQVEVPLGEDAEHYQVEIMNGSTVVRTLAATSPSTVYTAAQQVADFGNAQPSVSVRVSQVSPSYGRGAYRATTL